MAVKLINMKMTIPIKRFPLIFMLLISIINPVFSKENTSDSDSLKVAYIYNIAKFTRWPSSTWINTTEPFMLCFYGDDAVSKGLDKLQTKSINDHEINVVKVENDEDYQHCNAIYLNTQDRKIYRYLLSKIDKKTVLTITDDSPFFELGGFINLMEKDKRLRIQVSSKQLASSKLTLSSKLLKLSIVVDN